MLILTRRIGEAIVIGADDVRITIMGIKGKQVKLGIAAPDTVSIHRDELYDKIIEEDLGQRESSNDHRQSIRRDPRQKDRDS